MLSTLAIKSNTICSWRNCINQQMMQGGDYPHCSITVSATYFRIKYGKYHQLWSVSLSYNTTVPGVCDEALEDETERGFVTKRTRITTQCAFWHQSGHWKTDLTDLQCYIALHLQIHLGDWFDWYGATVAGKGNGRSREKRRGKDSYGHKLWASFPLCLSATNTEKVSAINGNSTWRTCHAD